MEKLTKAQAEKQFERRYGYPSSLLDEIGLELVECHCNGEHCPGWMYKPKPGSTRQFTAGMQARKLEVSNV